MIQFLIHQNQADQTVVQELVPKIDSMALVHDVHVAACIPRVVV